MSALAPALEAFFTERLISQRHASPHTIASYRDAWRLLLRFIHARTGKEPAQLDLADLGAPVISAFLEHLEQERRNSARTRNARLAAIHSFFHYAALRHPEHAGADRPGPGHPAQTLPADRGLLPDQARARRPGGSTRPGQLDRLSRSRPARRWQPRPVFGSQS